MKKLVAVLMVLAMALTAVSTLFAGALADAPAGEGSMTYTEWKDKLLSLQSFKFQNHKEGLGLGDCPVYTAPSKDALRFANNRQAVDTNKQLLEAGKTPDGWLLVRYEPVKGTTRVGYIPPNNVSKFKSKMSIKNFAYLSAVAAGPIEVTDNPIQGVPVFTTLQAGEGFHIIAKYTYNGNWWYIECTAEGKTARGFISRDKASFYPGTEVADNMNQVPVNMQTLGTPSVSPLNTEKTGELVINGNKNDERKRVHQDANMDSRWISVVYPTRTYPCYAAKTGTDGKTWYYVFVEEDSTFGWIYGDLANPVN